MLDSNVFTGFNIIIIIFVLHEHLIFRKPMLSIEAISWAALPYVGYVVEANKPSTVMGHKVPFDHCLAPSLGNVRYILALVEGTQSRPPAVFAYRNYRTFQIRTGPLLGLCARFLKFGAKHAYVLCVMYMILVSFLLSLKW